jgi:hypothetical protein
LRVWRPVADSRLDESAERRGPHRWD